MALPAAQVIHATLSVGNVKLQAKEWRRGGRTRLAAAAATAVHNGYAMDRDSYPEARMVGRAPKLATVAKSLMFAPTFVMQPRRTACWQD
ncbi:hypothetical protein MesoLj131b_73180 (plasmid) [Mesorhizobium sp. 131-2-5]|nr:hypothetical protein MesoLj131b_73180 [Mesorhizobium sp. 131-2-5]